MLAQVAGITVDDTIASVVAVLGSTRRSAEMDRARIDRRICELALEHAAGALGDDTYLARLEALREARDAIADGSETGVPAQRAIEWLHALAGSRRADARRTNRSWDDGRGRDEVQRHARRGPRWVAHRCGKAPATP